MAKIMVTLDEAMAARFSAIAKRRRLPLATLARLTLEDFVLIVEDNLPPADASAMMPLPQPGEK